MSKLVFIVVFCFSPICTIGCSNEDARMEVDSHMNNPWPVLKDTMRVLALGNSYTDDATSYLPVFLANSDIDGEKVCVYMGARAAASLQTWNDLFDINSVVKLSLKAGKLQMPVVEAPLHEILAQNWDVVVLQQQSDVAVDYSSYNPYLRNLIKGIKSVCINPNLSFVWQMPWSHYEGNDKKADILWRRISIATKKQVFYDGIDIVIPVGTAIQNARHSNLPQTGGMTRDGIHLSYGLGRYIASVTWFQVLFSHMDTDWMATDYLYHLSDNEKKAIRENSFYECYDVEREYQDICKKCAYAAVEDMYSISNIGD